MLHIHILSHSLCIKEREKRKGTENLWKNTRETSNAMTIIVTSLEASWLTRDREGRRLIFNEYPFISYAYIIYLKTLTEIFRL